MQKKIRKIHLLAIAHTYYTMRRFLGFTLKKSVGLYFVSRITQRASFFKHFFISRFIPITLQAKP
jgi:hypothetical protein